MSKEAWGWFKQRPLSEKLLKYAAADVICLLGCVPMISEKMRGSIRYGKSMQNLLTATQKRANRCHLHPEHAHLREYAFDKKDKFGSREVLSVGDDKGPTMKEFHRYQPLEQLDSILDLIPKTLTNSLRDPNCDRRRKQALEEDPDNPLAYELSKLRDIVIDKGRRPLAFFGAQKRFWLVDSPNIIAKDDDLQYVQTKLRGKFGDDNRAGLDGSLHRISGVPSKDGSRYYGFTFRIGRSFVGNADMINDLLFAPEHRDKCILLLGGPGSGKTSIVRDVAKQL